MYRNFHNSTNYDSRKMGGGEQPNYPLTEEWISELWGSRILYMDENELHCKYQLGSVSQIVHFKNKPVVNHLCKG